MLAESKFLPVPMPERICMLSINHPDRPEPMLTVGLQVLTENRDGLKLVPHKVVVVAIGKTIGDATEREFPLDVSSARTLAARIVEFCDAAEVAA